MADTTSHAQPSNEDNDKPYIDLRIAQDLIDKYKKTLEKNRQSASLTSSNSSSAPPSSTLAQPDSAAGEASSVSTVSKPTVAPKPAMVSRGRSVTTKDSAAVGDSEGRKLAAVSAGPVIHSAAVTVGDEDVLDCASSLSTPVTDEPRQLQQKCYSSNINNNDDMTSISVGSCHVESPANPNDVTANVNGCHNDGDGSTKRTSAELTTRIHVTGTAEYQPTYAVINRRGGSGGVDVSSRVDGDTVSVTSSSRSVENVDGVNWTPAASVAVVEPIYTELETIRPLPVPFPSSCRDPNELQERIEPTYESVDDYRQTKSGNIPASSSRFPSTGHSLTTRGYGDDDTASTPPPEVPEKSTRMLKLDIAAAASAAEHQIVVTGDVGGQGGRMQTSSHDTGSAQPQSNIVRTPVSATAVTSPPSPVVVTSEGLVSPAVRFVVRPVGSVPMSVEDLAPTRSAPAVIEHITALTRGLEQTSSGATGVTAGSGTTTLKDAVYLWPTNVDMVLELRGMNLDLVDLQKGIVVNSQPLRSIRLWGTGRGSDSRDFAYVSRTATGSQFMCHVFRCPQGSRADQITMALRDVCWKMQMLKERTNSRLQQQQQSSSSAPSTLSKSSTTGSDGEGRGGGNETTFDRKL